jgi:hypothetical protein
MDLNHLYSQHQLAIMCAAGASSRLAKTKYLATAELLAFRIGNYQLSKGAAAASSWLCEIEPQRKPIKFASGAAL